MWRRYTFELAYAYKKRYILEERMLRSGRKFICMYLASIVLAA